MVERQMKFLKATGETVFVPESEWTPAVQRMAAEMSATAIGTKKISGFEVYYPKGVPIAAPAPAPVEKPVVAVEPVTAVAEPIKPVAEPTVAVAEPPPIEYEYTSWKEDFTGWIGYKVQERMRALTDPLLAAGWEYERTATEPGRPMEVRKFFRRPVAMADKPVTVSIAPPPPKPPEPMYPEYLKSPIFQRELKEMKVTQPPPEPKQLVIDLGDITPMLKVATMTQEERTARDAADIQKNIEAQRAAAATAAEQLRTGEIITKPSAPIMGTAVVEAAAKPELIPEVSKEWKEATGEEFGKGVQAFITAGHKIPAQFKVYVRDVPSLEGITKEYKIPSIEQVIREQALTQAEMVLAKATPLEKAAIATEVILSPRGYKAVGEAILGLPGVEAIRGVDVRREGELMKELVAEHVVLGEKYEEPVKLKTITGKEVIRDPKLMQAATSLTKGITEALQSPAVAIEAGFLAGAGAVTPTAQAAMAIPATKISTTAAGVLGTAVTAKEMRESIAEGDLATAVGIGATAVGALGAGLLGAKAQLAHQLAETKPFIKEAVSVFPEEEKTVSKVKIKLEGGMGDKEFETKVFTKYETQFRDIGDITIQEAAQKSAIMGKEMEAAGFGKGISVPETEIEGAKIVGLKPVTPAVGGAEIVTEQPGLIGKLKRFVGKGLDDPILGYDIKETGAKIISTKVKPDVIFSIGDVAVEGMETGHYRGVTQIAKSAKEFGDIGLKLLGKTEPITALSKAATTSLGEVLTAVTPPPTTGLVGIIPPAVTRVVPAVTPKPPTVVTAPTKPKLPTGFGALPAPAKPIVVVEPAIFKAPVITKAPKALDILKVPKVLEAPKIIKAPKVLEAPKSLPKIEPIITKPKKVIEPVVAKVEPIIAEPKPIVPTKPLKVEEIFKEPVVKEVVEPIKLTMPEMFKEPKGKSPLQKQMEKVSKITGRAAEAEFKYEEYTGPFGKPVEQPKIAYPEPYLKQLEKEGFIVKKVPAVPTKVPVVPKVEPIIPTKPLALPKVFESPAEPFKAPVEMEFITGPKITIEPKLPKPTDVGKLIELPKPSKPFVEPVIPKITKVEPFVTVPSVFKAPPVLEPVKEEDLARVVEKDVFKDLGKDLEKGLRQEQQAIQEVGVIQEIELAKETGLGRITDLGFVQKQVLEQEKLQVTRLDTGLITPTVPTTIVPTAPWRILPPGLPTFGVPAKRRRVVFKRPRMRRRFRYTPTVLGVEYGKLGYTVPKPPKHLGAAVVGIRPMVAPDFMSAPKPRKKKRKGKTNKAAKRKYNKNFMRSLGF